VVSQSQAVWECGSNRPHIKRQVSDTFFYKAINTIDRISEVNTSIALMTSRFCDPVPSMLPAVSDNFKTEALPLRKIYRQVKKVEEVKEVVRKDILENSTRRLYVYKKPPRRAALRIKSL
jgi:hypothetical protein